MSNTNPWDAEIKGMQDEINKGRRTDNPSKRIPGEARPNRRPQRETTFPMRDKWGTDAKVDESTDEVIVKEKSIAEMQKDANTLERRRLAEEKKNRMLRDKNNRAAGYGLSKQRF